MTTKSVAMYSPANSNAVHLLYDECTSVIIHLPQSTEFDEFDASEVTEQDVDQIERQRTQIGRP